MDTVTNTLSIILYTCLVLSIGIVIGWFSRAKVGRWALLVVIVAAMVGAAYLYGMIGGLQAGKGFLPRLW